ncbi:hypothetical protein [Huintestinicola sp.]|uniref:hypothetical protein n=1 Tax=Huintestinicola sp. TaxID=2981661 RepID=UPI003D7C4E24
MAGKLFEALGKNAELSKKFMEASSKEEAFEVVKDIIPGYTIDEMISELKDRKENANAVSDDELEAVAGGTSMDDIYISDEEFFSTLFKRGKWLIGKLF